MGASSQDVHKEDWASQDMPRVMWMRRVRRCRVGSPRAVEVGVRVGRMSKWRASRWRVERERERSGMAPM
jgi:hypothetical protein